MGNIDDYRRTKYCPELVDIQDKKKKLERKIKDAHPRAQDMHTYISDNSDVFKSMFIQVYNGKCAYCGVSVDLLQKNIFEIDHFLYEKSSRFTSKKEAGYMGNLILACHDCNHNKGSFGIEDEQYDKLHPDGEGIKESFIRDEQYYIRISDKNKDNRCIGEFYKRLKLGSELHRLDYLLINIIGMQRNHKDNNKLCSGLGKILDIVRAKRNIM